MSVKGFKLSNGTVEQYDYNYLANKPSSSGDGLTADVKQAILDCFQNVAWVSDDGQDYYDALYDALYPPANLSSISCVYTQSGTVYDTDTLNSLKTDLVVTAHYDNSTTAVVTNYTLSGTLTEGTSTITATYGGKTATFNVTVTEKVIETVTITWTGSGTDKTADPIIDATSKDGYLTIPFVQDDTNLSSTATDGGDAMACVPYLYSDSSATTLVGYYDIATGEVYTSSSWSWNSRPNLVFGQNTLVAPRGYYVKIKVSNNRSTFTSNSTCGTYLNAHATTVTLP